MPNPRILGPDGKPLRAADTREALARPWAVPTLTGVRQLWDVSSVASGLTPETLASVLRQADEGDGRAYLRLAHEMEQREAHYRSVLGTRKRAVTRLPVTVEAASDAKPDVALADEVRALIRAPGWRLMLGESLDALGKGFSAVEMRWDTSRTPWRPRDRWDETMGKWIRGYHRVDPRWFRYDKADGETLRLLDDTAPTEGVPLPRYKYIAHEPALMSGAPLGRGLARVACVAYMAKSFSLKDWLAFAELYGMPIRVGKYGRSANEDDIAILVSAVANLGTDAAAAIPDSMQIDFVEAGSNGKSSGDVFERLATWADKQISKAVLGQTASSDGTAGALGNQQAQDEVRDDLRDADAEELADTLNRDLVGSYLALNHGAIDPEDAPSIVLRARERDDIQGLSDALAKLVPLGLRVEASVVRDKLGLPDPPETGQDGRSVELLGSPAPVAPAVPVATNRLALNRQEPDITDQQIAQLGRAAEPLIGAILGQIRRELDAAPDLPAFNARIRELFPELNGADLAGLLGQAFMAAELAGMDEAAP